MLKRSLCGVSLLLAAHISQADVMTQNIIVNEQSTDISETLTFDLFDTVGGTRVLESVLFSVNGIVNGTARVENLDTVARVVEATLSADVSVSGIISGDLVSLAPSVINSMSVSGYDGTTDFGGTSGLTFLNMNADQFGELFLNDAASLTAYTGIGNSTLNFTVNATSEVTGGGNLTTSFLTRAGGSVSIVYNYRDDLATIETNEPAYLALIGLGLFGFSQYKRKAV